MAGTLTLDAPHMPVFRYDDAGRLTTPDTETIAGLALIYALGQKAAGPTNATDWHLPVRVLSGHVPAGRYWLVTDGTDSQLRPDYGPACPPSLALLKRVAEALADREPKEVRSLVIGELAQLSLKDAGTCRALPDDTLLTAARRAAWERLYVANGGDAPNADRALTRFDHRVMDRLLGLA
jgi:hypothetical protein